MKVFFFWVLPCVICLVSTGVIIAHASDTQKPFAILTGGFAVFPVINILIAILAFSWFVVIFLPKQCKKESK